MEKLKRTKQAKLFNDKIDLITLDSVIGSGYEEDVAKLAIEDKIAYRAARKNMQIHSAIVLKINGSLLDFLHLKLIMMLKNFVYFNQQCIPVLKMLRYIL